MNSAWKSSLRSVRILVVCLTGILLAGTVAGCRSGSYGRIAHSREVTDMFNTYKIPPEPLYYYSGPDEFPLAFIGVNKEYTLESALWKPVILSPALLQKWLNFNFGSAQREDVSLSVWGAYLVGPNDERIGYWYSVRNWQDVGTVKMGEGNAVYITTPRGEDPNKRKFGSGR